MAIITTAVPVVCAYTPFITPPGQLIQNTNIPRGVLRCNSGRITKPAKGAADQSVLSITATLPTGFGYVLRDMLYQMFESGTALELDDVENIAPGSFGDFDGTTQDTWFDLVSIGAGYSIEYTGSRKTWALNKGPVGVMWSPAGGSITLASWLTDKSGTTTVEQSVEAQMSFFVYDYEQILHAESNLPVFTAAGSSSPRP